MLGYEISAEIPLESILKKENKVWKISFNYQVLPQVRKKPWSQQDYCLLEMIYMNIS